MSDDEEAPPAVEEEPTLDEKGFHIVRTGGKLQNQMNPLQLKMEREKKEREEKAKKDAKKAALDKRLAAFGGNKSSEGEQQAARITSIRRRLRRRTA
jgi:predicted ABC-type transport system involved in lysophospholipase L1 biosynthesis ATPase subunit